MPYCIFLWCLQQHFYVFFFIIIIIHIPSERERGTRHKQEMGSCEMVTHTTRYIDEGGPKAMFRQQGGGPSGSRVLGHLPAPTKLSQSAYASM